jgi:hypothetical protein
VVISEEFMRHAAECEYMAKVSPNVGNRVVWGAMAERWVRCAEMAKKQSSTTLVSRNVKLHRRPAQAWAHTNVADAA